MELVVKENDWGSPTGLVCLVTLRKPLTTRPVAVELFEDTHLDVVLAVMLATLQLAGPAKLLKTSV